MRVAAAAVLEVLGLEVAGRTLAGLDLVSAPALARAGLGAGVVAVGRYHHLR